jgi:hypothetical protein
MLALKILIFLVAILNNLVKCNDIIPISEPEDQNKQLVINLSVVACGDRVPETLVLLKSALMFTKAQLHFYIFTEPELKSQFVVQVS